MRLPKAFRFSGSEVLIEKHGDEVVLRPVTHTKFKSFTEIARPKHDHITLSDQRLQVVTIVLGPALNGQAAGGQRPLTGQYLGEIAPPAETVNLAGRRA